MTHGNSNPSLASDPKRWSDLGHNSNCTCYDCYIVGPGGKTTNIENNEKGMLDSIPLYLSQNVEDDSFEGGFGLRAEHDKHYQGIYTSTHYVSETWPEIRSAGGEGDFDKGRL